MTTPSVTQAITLQALGQFIVAATGLSMSKIILGQANRVAEPGSPNFVMMTPTSAIRLAQNTDDWNFADVNPTTRSALAPMQYTVQLDFHGSGGGDYAQDVVTLLRDAYAAEFFKSLNVGVAPLYAGDPIQTALVNAESQYEDRWTLSAVLQTNPVISTPQDFAATLVAGVIDVDATYPPGGN